MNNQQSVWTLSDEEEIKEEQKDYQWFKKYDQNNLQKEIEALRNQYIDNSDKA